MISLSFFDTGRQSRELTPFDDASPSELRKFIFAFRLTLGTSFPPKKRSGK